MFDQQKHKNMSSSNIHIVLLALHTCLCLIKLTFSHPRNRTEYMGVYPIQNERDVINDYISSLYYFLSSVDHIAMLKSLVSYE